MSLVFEVTEWGSVTVRSQEEWDALMRHKSAGARFARIDAPASETIRLFHSDGGLAVTVAGESSVATLGVDVRACDNARVRASGVCIVSAQENVRVWACGRVIVHAYDDARVWVSGTCVVYARENTAVWAGSMVTVYKETRFGPFRGSVQGGRVVVKRDVDEMTSEQWCRAALVHVDEGGMARLFKATDREGVSRRGGVYRVGEVVGDSANWKGDRFFGGGLHVSPSPGMALVRSQLDEWKGVRFVEVTCPVSELVSVADDVCKCPRVSVVREVDSWGEPL